MSPVVLMRCSWNAPMSRSTGQNRVSMVRNARVCTSASGEPRVPTRSGRVGRWLPARPEACGCVRRAAAAAAARCSASEGGAGSGKGGAGSGSGWAGGIGLSYYPHRPMERWRWRIPGRWRQAGQAEAGQAQAGRGGWNEGPVLAIESSCDETACAILDRNGTVLAECLLSQAEHKPFGGVVPEIAARAHLSHLPALVAQALREAGVTADRLGAVAASCGPGLIGGLIVGSGLAKGMALALGVPFMAVNHLEAHALTARLPGLVPGGAPFPYLLLLVSGGHCQCVAVDGLGRYRRLGGTVDDAAGEAFDKVAKMLGLPWPGGPALEQLARRRRPAGAPSAAAAAAPSRLRLLVQRPQDGGGAAHRRPAGPPFRRGCRGPGGLVPGGGDGGAGGPRPQRAGHDAGSRAAGGGGRGRCQRSHTHAAVRPGGLARHRLRRPAAAAVHGQRGDGRLGRDRGAARGHGGEPRGGTTSALAAGRAWSGGRVLGLLDKPGPA